MSSVRVSNRSMTVSTVVPKKARAFIDAVGAVRTRLLALRDKVETALEAAGVQNNIDSIHAALRALESKSGQLELPYPISLLDLFLIWGAPEAMLIRKITFKNLDTHFRADDFAHERERFLELFGIECPDGLLKTFHLREKLNQVLGERLNIKYISFGDFGLSIQLLSKKPLATNALIYNKHGHHELNYVPYAAYGSDAVTYGLLYDFHKRTFLTSAYHGDGEVSSYGNVLEPFVKKFTEPWRRIRPRSYARYFEDPDDDAYVEYFVANSGPWDQSDGEKALKNHTINHFIRSYLKTNPTRAKVIGKDDLWRYSGYLAWLNSERLEQENPSTFLFSGIAPVTPLPLTLFQCYDRNAVAQWGSFVELVAQLHGTVCPASKYGRIFAGGYYRDLRNWLHKHESTGVFDGSELRQFTSANSELSKNDNLELFHLLDGELHKQYLKAMEMASLGAEGYSFVLAMYLWKHCVDGSLSKMAVELLDQLGSALCPDFIKKTARLHAAVRHGKYIPA